MRVRSNSTVLLEKQMLATQEKYISEEEYLAFERRSMEKHEYIDGKIYAMSGGTRKHAALGARAVQLLLNALDGKPCDATGADQRIRIPLQRTYSYADAVAFCPDARFEGEGEDLLLDPKVIVEVLSASTARYDRYGKFERYKQIESFSDYLLVSQKFVHVDHFHRNDNGWQLTSYYRRDDSIVLESIDATIKLNDLYKGIEIPEGVILLEPPAPDEETDENIV